MVKKNKKEGQLMDKKWLVDTKDGFCEKVNKNDLLKWGKSLDNNLDLNLEYSITDAITSLTNYGYEVSILKTEEKS